MEKFPITMADMQYCVGMNSTGHLLVHCKPWLEDNDAVQCKSLMIKFLSMKILTR